MPQRRVMVATPSYSSEVSARYVQSLTAAWVYCLYHKVELELNIAERYSLVQFARNRLAQDFLDDESFTHLMWIDSDLGFDPRAIMRLVQHDKDVVGGAYPVKTHPMWFPVEAVGDVGADGLQEACVLPTGFLLVSRKAMEAVADAPMYVHHHQGREIPTRHIFDLELQDRDDGRKDLIGEDIVLCHKLRQKGFQLWLDPDIDFVHVGMHGWHGNLSKAQKATGERLIGSSAA